MKKFSKIVFSFLLAFSFLLPSVALAEEAKKKEASVGVTENKSTEKKTEETKEPKKKEEKKEATEAPKETLEREYPVVNITKITLNEIEYTNKNKIDEIVKDLELKWSFGDKITSKVDSSEIKLYGVGANSQKVDFTIGNKFYKYLGSSINTDAGIGKNDAKDFSFIIKQKDNTASITIQRDTFNLKVKVNGPKIQLKKLKVKLNGDQIELGKDIVVFKGSKNKLEFTGFDDNFVVYKDGKAIKSPYEFTMSEKYDWEFELKPSRSVNRLSGTNRFLTALDTAREVYEKPETVIVANGRDGSADALAAGPLAKALNAPILLVEKDSIKKEVLDYIHNDNLKRVVIVGGKGSVSSKVFNELKGNNSTLKVDRIAGANRYETSQKIVKELIEKYKFNKEVILVDGRQNADALSAAPYAVLKKSPILLVSPNTGTVQAKKMLNELEVKTSVVIGGDSSVSDSTINALGVKNSLRIKGTNRYITSQEVCKKLQGEKDYINSLIIANGTDKYSIDALTASSLLNKVNAPILLVDGKSYTDSLKKFVDDLKLSPFNAYLVGGESAISAEINNNIGY